MVEELKVLIVSDAGYLCAGGGEEFLYDFGLICSEMNIKTKWIYFMKYTNNCNEPLKEEEHYYPNENYELFGIPNKWNTQKIEIEIRDYRPQWVIHQGFNREIVLNVAKKYGVPFLTGMCFWNGVIDLIKVPSNKNVTNYLILENEKHHKIHPVFSRIYQNMFSVSPFMTYAVHRINKMTPQLSIYSLSLTSRFPRLVSNEKKYITIINLHEFKGGSVALHYLEKSVKDDPPICCIHSDFGNPNAILAKKINNVLTIKNEGREIPHLFLPRQSNLAEVYSQTKILLIPSLVDETFCRVAYEGIFYEMPMISSRHGNLPYLLCDAAIYMNDNPGEWLSKIRELNQDDKIQERLRWACGRRKLWFNDDLLREQISEALLYHRPKYPVKVGFFGPWGDQGLGIQIRNYCRFFQCQGYPICVLGFKSYFASDKNPKNQVVPGEWSGFEVIEHKRGREEITMEDVRSFIERTKITHLIIPETCYSNVFKIAKYVQSVGIRTIAIPNMEIVRSSEIGDHVYFDELWMNYPSDEKIWNSYMEDGKLGSNPPKIVPFGYYHDHPGMWYKRKYWNEMSPLRFFCVGGLNSISRKSIPQIVQDFIQFQEIYNLPATLIVYIQGKESPILPKHSSIQVIAKSLPYNEILRLYHTYDIHIHMGTHEGLGLGFYEAIQQGCPVLTMNGEPNNEIIIDNKNGWFVDCRQHPMTDNLQGIVLENHYQSRSFIEKLRELCLMTLEERNEWMVSMEDYMLKWMKDKKKDWIMRLNNLLVRH